MSSKTPQFDALLDEILAKLVSHSRVCGACKKDFDITAEDVHFLKMLRVPAPKLCPDCRHQRRLSFANYSNIYRRKCNVPGHTENMISLVAPVVPWVTYDYETYYSDAWDPGSYGREATAGSFFDQFRQLLEVVPQPGVRRGAESPNSDFSFYGKYMKDCYYVFGGRRSEDIMYGSSIYDSKHAMDCYFIRSNENVYDQVTTSDCYKCAHAYFSSSCIECDFVYDCRNCQNCFGCVNLRNKNYCWFNEQLTKEEYQKRRRAVDLGSRAVFTEYKKKFWDFVKTNPIRAVRAYQTQNVSGNDIKQSKDCQHCFQVEQSENLRYAYLAVMDMKDSMDVAFAGHAERLYDTQNVGNKSSNVKFSFAVKETIDSEFLISCTNCTNCFGCIGLKNASYMIFNQQYDPESYFKKVDEIKTMMLSDGAYGEFFPMAFSPYAYNSSFAHIIYPMTEEEVHGHGLLWQPDADVDVKNLKSMSVSELPDTIADVTEDICAVAIIGETSKKPFRLTARELAFYKKNNIALPTDTPYMRIIERFKVLNNFQVSEESCDSCGNMIESAYRKTDGYRPYCEACYQRDIL